MAESDEVVEETENEDISEEAGLDETPGHEASKTLAAELFDAISGSETPEETHTEASEKPPEESSEAEDQEIEQLAQPNLVRVGSDVYEYDFVETAVQEAEKVREVGVELENELEQIRQTRTNLQELDYLLRAIGGRLGDPQFYQGLQRLLQGDYSTPAPRAEQQDTWERSEEQPPTSQPPPIEPIIQALDHRVEQAVVPLYAVYAKQAADIFAADLEQRYNISLTDEERSQIRGRAIDRGDFRSEHLLGRTAENPLEKAFFELYGPKLLEQRRVEEEQKKLTGTLPEKSRQGGIPEPKDARSRSLAKEFLASFNS